MHVCTQQCGARERTSERVREKERKKERKKKKKRGGREMRTPPGGAPSRAKPNEERERCAAWWL